MLPMSIHDTQNRKKNAMALQSVHAAPREIS